MPFRTYVDGCPLADGFIFPVGPPDANGYYNAQLFGKNNHLGERLGTMGNVNGQYYAHLHLELRTTIGMPIGGDMLFSQADTFPIKNGFFTT